MAFFDLKKSFLFSCLCLYVPAVHGLAQPAVDSTAALLRFEISGKGGGEDLLRTLGLQKQRSVAVDSVAGVAAAALRRFAALGYHDARTVILPPDPGPGDTVLVQVQAGKRWRLAGVHLLAADSLVHIRELRDLQRSRDLLRLERNIEEALQALGEHGYPFAQIRIDTLRARTDEDKPVFELTLKLTENQQAFIDTIAVSGNSLTRRKVIIRELPVRAGDLYRQSRIDAIPDELMRLGYFKAVAEPELVRLPDGRLLLHIGIEEGNTNVLNGVAGYNPATETQPGYVTGLLDLQFGNLMGTGRKVLAKWEKRSQQTQELDMRYREPWVLGYPLHIEGGFRQLIQDTLYVERRTEFSLAWPVVRQVRVVATGARYSITPDSIGVALLNLPSSRSVATGAGLTYDSRDDLLNPSRGAYFSTVIENISKTIEGDSALAGKFNQKKITMDADWFQPLWRFQVLAVGVHLRQITSSEGSVPITEQFRFGGATTLRGYREEQFRGARVFWVNTEYRYLLSRRSRAFVFFDLGYYARAEVEEFKRSFGFGVRLETRLGIIGVDYGLGEGDSILQGKVHVRLLNRF